MRMCPGSSLYYSVEECLDPQAVTRQQYRSLALIPQREGKHTSQLRHAARPVLFIQMDDRLGVSSRVEGMSEPFELAAQLHKVINLTVKYDPQRAVLIACSSSSKMVLPFRL